MSMKQSGMGMSSVSGGYHGMSGERQKKGLWLDPRAKLFLILICVLASMFAPFSRIPVCACCADCNIGNILRKMEICHKGSVLLCCHLRSDGLDHG